MSSFRHCDVGCILIHHIKEAGSVREGLSGKLISKLDAVVRVEYHFSIGCTGLTSNDSVMEEVRDISTDPSHSQLQDIFRVPGVFHSTCWGVSRLTIGKISGEMYLPPGPIVEAFLRAVEQS